MKRYMIFAVAAIQFILSGCGSVLMVEVSNPSDIDRDTELIEVSLDDIKSRLKIQDGESFILKDGAVEVPYQQTYDGKVVFPAQLKAQQVKSYRFCKGTPAEVVTKVCGDHYPKRVDDLCWENDLIGFRTYGFKEDAPSGYDIFIKEKAILNNSIDAAHEEECVVTAADRTMAARDVMCKKFYDVRTFGAVMSTGKNAGQVRGPIQLTFARSVDPIMTSEHSITRMAVATEKEAEKQGGDNRTMGRKATIPYGLYVCHGFISANLAKQTGFSEDDLQLFWEALKNMFDVDRSAARGLMSAQKLIVFQHNSMLGNAPANKLFDRVKIEKTTEIPRSFSDYCVTIDRDNLPEGVEIIEMI